MEMDCSEPAGDGDATRKRPAGADVVDGVIAMVLDQLATAADGDVFDGQPGPAERMLERLDGDYRILARSLLCDYMNALGAGSTVGRDGVWMAWSGDRIEQAVYGLRSLGARFCAEATRLDELARTAPRWAELTDESRGQVVVFFEHALKYGLAGGMALPAAGLRRGERAVAGP